MPDGTFVDGTEVPIKESLERWCDITLVDDSVVRVKYTVIKAIRIDGEFDADGNPVYIMMGHPDTMVISKFSGMVIPETSEGGN